MRLLKESTTKILFLLRFVLMVPIILCAPFLIIYGLGGGGGSRFLA
jgi:hypothetical protein